MEFTNFSITTYLKDILKIKHKPQDPKLLKLLSMAKLFDFMGIKAYSMAAGTLMKRTNQILADPEFAKKVRQYPEWKKVTEEDWELFLLMPEIGNHIRPIHQKRMVLLRADIEGKLSDTPDLTAEEIKKYIVMLKQFLDTEINTGMVFVNSESMPTQYFYPCLNEMCDNEIMTYVPQPVICVKCHRPLTKLITPKV